MTRTLPKGGNVALADVAPASPTVTVALGWDDHGYGRGAAHGPDLDGVVILSQTATDRDLAAGGPAAAGGVGPRSWMVLAQQIPNPDERPGAPPPSRPRTWAT